MRKIEACIFDLDGVICDTARYHYMAWKSLAGKLGIRFTEADNERLKGVSRMDSLNILLSLGGKVYSEVEKNSFAEKKNARYLEYITSMKEDEILPGVLGFLKYCRNHGIKVALGSVSENAMLIIRNLRLECYFDAIVDGTRVQKAKPDPEVFLLGAADLGVAPEHIVVFEDARAGLAGAKSAGMLAVGIGVPEVLADADFVMEGFSGRSPEKIMEMISGSGTEVHRGRAEGCP